MNRLGRFSILPGRRFLVLVVILAAEFALLEAGMRLQTGSEGSAGFQALFMRDPAVGHRLQPGASLRYTTVEFSTELRVNAQGVRDDDDIGPKGEHERRVVLLGDSLVLSVQVPFATTFGEGLERRLNARGDGEHWRVINAGVQGYGPVQDWFLFDRVIASLQPDVVLIVAFVGNDAIEAYADEGALDAERPLDDQQTAVMRFRRLLRSSLVWQSARVRWDQLKARVSTGTPERPLATYLADPPPEVWHGLEVTRRAFGLISDRARDLGARTGIVLMPARFQTDDFDYGNLSAAVRAAGGELVRNSGSERFAAALAPLGLPLFDLLPILERQPQRTGLFFQRNVHLTPRGHDVVAGALFDFVTSSGLVGSSR